MLIRAFRFFKAMIVVASATIGLGTAARAESCQAELGARRAAALVRQCQEISPATHPPCNAANTCALIQSEVKRGCDMARNDAPGWCHDYDDD
jgi:hypothetical protein